MSTPQDEIFYFYERDRYVSLMIFISQHYCGMFTLCGTWVLQARPTLRVAKIFVKGWQRNCWVLAQHKAFQSKFLRLSFQTW
jgi:hypothetical protein